QRLFSYYAVVTIHASADRKSSKPTMRRKIRAFRGSVLIVIIRDKPRGCEKLFHHRQFDESGLSVATRPGLDEFPPQTCPCRVSKRSRRYRPAQVDSACSSRHRCVNRVLATHCVRQ